MAFVLLDKRTNASIPIAGNIKIIPYTIKAFGMPSVLAYGLKKDAPTQTKNRILHGQLVDFRNSKMRFMSFIVFYPFLYAAALRISFFLPAYSLREESAPYGCFFASLL